MFILLILRWILTYGKLGALLLEEFVPKLPVWPTIVITLVITIYGYGFHKCEVKQVVAESKMEKKHDKIETNIDNIHGSKLDKRLRPCYRD